MSGEIEAFSICTLSLIDRVRSFGVRNKVVKLVIKWSLHSSTGSEGKNEDISPVIENPFYFFRHPFILGGNVKYTITPQTILYNRQQGLSSDVDFFSLSLLCGLSL